jgi:hypothetical protein
MGTTTFTGPITAGDIVNTSGTTVGTDVSNVGYVQMCQSAVVNQATNVGSAGVYKTDIVIPANSQILSIQVLKTTAWSGVATTINVGTSTTGTQLALAADNDLSTTLGVSNVIPGNNATQVGNWKDVGTTDVQIYTKSTNTGTGVGILSIEYLQAINLTA